MKTFDLMLPNLCNTWCSRSRFSEGLNVFRRGSVRRWLLELGVFFALVFSASSMAHAQGSGFIRQGTSATSPRCLDAGPNHGSGTVYILDRHPCDGSNPYQQWIRRDEQLVHKQTGECLTGYLPNGNVSQQSSLTSCSISYDPRQDWVEDGALLRRGNTGFCLELVNNGNGEYGTVLRPCSNSVAAQKWIHQDPVAISVATIRAEVDQGLFDRNRVVHYRTETGRAQLTMVGASCRSGGKVELRKINGNEQVVCVVSLPTSWVEPLGDHLFSVWATEKVLTSTSGQAIRVSDGISGVVTLRPDQLLQRCKTDRAWCLRVADHQMKYTLGEIDNYDRKACPGKVGLTGDAGARRLQADSRLRLAAEWPQGRRFVVGSIGGIMYLTGGFIIGVPLSMAIASEPFVYKALAAGVLGTLGLGSWLGAGFYNNFVTADSIPAEKRYEAISASGLVGVITFVWESGKLAMSGVSYAANVAATAVYGVSSGVATCVSQIFASNEISNLPADVELVALPRGEDAAR